MRKNKLTDGYTLKVIYRGGLPDLPKAKAADIALAVTDSSFTFTAGSAAKKFWTDLTIPFDRVRAVTVEQRHVSTFESIAGGLNSRQLNQANNLHFSYVAESGVETLLRVEVLTGITVMGQAKKAAEFADYLRSHGIRFGTATVPVQPDITDQLRKLGELRDAGILTEEEFAAKKTELLAKM